MDKSRATLTIVKFRFCELSNSCKPLASRVSEDIYTEASEKVRVSVPISQIRELRPMSV